MPDDSSNSALAYGPFREATLAWKPKSLSEASVSGRFFGILGTYSIVCSIL